MDVLAREQKSNKKLVVVHLIYRFDIGGLERVMVNCINAMNASQAEFQHVIIALTEIAEQTYPLEPDVQMFQLNKRAGSDLGCHWRLFKLLKEIKPAILHTYNLATIEYHPISYLAGVKGHIHAEHGRDVSDPQGLNGKHNLLRRLLSPFIDFFVPVSKDLADWLVNTVKLSDRKIAFIRNGIETKMFYHLERCDQMVKFVHVARLNKVKDQANLINAFALLVQGNQLTTKQTKLTIVGDGSEMANLQAQAKSLQVDEYIEFTGAQSNVADWLAGADVFVLSSIAEGIPMTILEAMASNLAVISTDVGGLSEIIEHNVNGLLVEKCNAQALANAMQKYIVVPELVDTHGGKAKEFVEQKFSEQAMVEQYLTLYAQSLDSHDLRSHHVRN